MNNLTTISSTAVSTISNNFRVFNAENDKEYQGKVKDSLIQFCKDNSILIGAFMTIPQMIMHGVCFKGAPRFEMTVAIPQKSNENIEIDIQDNGEAHAVTTEQKFLHKKLCLYPLEKCTFYEEFDVDRTLNGRYLKNLSLSQEEKDNILPTRIKLMQLLENTTKEIVVEDAPIVEESVVEEPVVEDTVVEESVASEDTKTESKVDVSENSILDIEMTDELQLAFNSAAQFVAKEDFRAFLHNVCVRSINGTVHIISSNGHILYIYNTNVKTTDTNTYLFKIKECKKIDKLKVNSFREILNHIPLDGMEKYPNVACLFDDNIKNISNNMTVSSNYLTKATKVASKFASARVSATNITIRDTSIAVEPIMKVIYQGKLRIIISRVVV